jgi:hypothetical protein
MPGTQPIRTFYFLTLFMVLGAAAFQAQTPEVQAPAPAASPDKAPPEQDKPADAACGPMTLSSWKPQHPQFSVRVDKDQHPLAEASEGKATVYVIQQAWGLYRHFDITGFALDGKWIGANKGDSYFSLAVEPGEHHACSWVSVGRYWKSRDRLLLHSLTAEAGETYYFVQKEVPHTDSLEFNLVDPEQAKPLISAAGFATTTEVK